MKVFFTYALIVLLSILSVGCKKVLNPRVKYLVEGTAQNYVVSYKDALGTTISADTVPYYWSISFDGKKGDNLMISATAIESSCWAKVYIYIDGKLLGSDYQFGNYPTASVTRKLKLVF